MTRWQQAFFELLRCGLWTTEPSIAYFPLSADDWQKVYQEACRQTVQGIVYDALQRLPDNLVPPQTITWQWTSDVTRIIADNRRIRRAVTATRQLLCQIGTEPILLKGEASASCYPRPDLRVCGDIDWYLPETCFGTVASSLEQQGYPCQPKADGSMSFYYDNIEIEIHPRLADILRPRHQQALTDIIRNEGYATLTINGDEGTSTDVRTTGYITTLLLHAAHIFKHTASVGIGLRQFCDLALAYHKNHEHIDKRALTQAYKQTGFTRWSQLLEHFLTEYLGLDAGTTASSTLRHNNDTRHLLQLVIQGGNFGQHSHQWQQAQSKGHSRYHTVLSYLSHLPFTFRYAPTEALYLFFNLAKGQKNI